MKMNKEEIRIKEDGVKMRRNIIGFILVIMLLFLALPVTSANGIEILDMGVGYDMIDHYGFLVYQNTADFNQSGVIMVFIDGDIVAGKILDMPIRYVAGFRCSPAKTIEFPLKTTKGDHTIVAYVLSQNISVEPTYEYTMEGWEDKAAEEETEFEEETEDWLKCGWCS